jgi:hypothetical protein
VTQWRAPSIRTIRDLLWAIAGGARLVKCEPWRFSEDSAWHEWMVVRRDGTRQIVEAKIAVTAHRKGMVTFEEGE